MFLILLAIAGGFLALNHFRHHPTGDGGKFQPPQVRVLPPKFPDRGRYQLIIQDPSGGFKLSYAGDDLQLVASLARQWDESGTNWWLFKDGDLISAGSKS